MLKVHETFDTSGVLSQVFLSFEEGALAIVDREGKFVLPNGALDAAMKRFGAPLDEREPVTDVAELALAAGSRVRHVRHRSRFDVIARDYLVYEAPGRIPLCALATTIAGALAHLARA